MLERYVERLDRELNGGGDLLVETAGIYSLPLEGGLNLVMQETPEGFYLYCEVCNIDFIPKLRREEFFTDFLHINLFGNETENAVIGLDEEGLILTLSQEIRSNVSYEDFYAIVEDFVNSVDFLQAEARSYS
jgi:Tir chaperone protein (CesT) family